MFKALLLAIVVGVGAANISSPNLVDRANDSPSKECCIKDRCPRTAQQSAVTAYCSSYLKVPKTATKTVTTCSTTTILSTSITATVTVAGTTTTSIITGCQLPATATTTASASQTPTGGDSSVPAPEGKRDAESETHERRDDALSKPSCLSSHRTLQDISSVCSCLSLRPQTTKTTTSTDVKTINKTVKSAATVTGGPSTTTVYQAPANPTFAIVNDAGDIFRALCGQRRRALMSRQADNCQIDQIQFYTNSTSIETRVVNFVLNGADGLDGTLFLSSTAQAGQNMGVPTVANRKGGAQDYVVRNDPASPNSASLTPLTCSISFKSADGTCPLDCQPSGDDSDVNQSQNQDDSGTWYLGPAGAVSSNTFNNFAVSAELID
ncbi:hypothetical protein DOTSEDRAFT_48945 [Dothistroma septosporum NZE10]|uniref:Uncharacterized protein n=1 Tax=Dothistroma septosporum (strain NZE10 / CBS 128990) TaxID=675120 RepID=N1PY71_DOTSN|nr:hypothetical protein DOTSEDRAFT_48945 [Dothistroma septosporum NZE10]